jgi:hypothetical protein
MLDLASDFCHVLSLRGPNSVEAFELLDHASRGEFASLHILEMALEK